MPKADAIVVAPATFNTINKWAFGIGGTLAVSLLCEALGRGTPPMVAVPYLKVDLARHPAFLKNLYLLPGVGGLRPLRAREVSVAADGSLGGDSGCLASGPQTIIQLNPADLA